MQRLLLIIFSLLSFSSPALALPKLPPLPVEENAFRALKDNNLVKAYSLGKECLRKNPNATYAKQCVVVAALNGIGTLDDADTTLRTMKSDDYEEGQVVYYWMLLEFTRKNYKKAKIYSDQLAALPSSKASIHGNLLRADLFHRFGDNQTALKILSEWKEFEWVTSIGQKGSCEKTIKAITRLSHEFPMADMSWLRDVVPLNKVPLQKLGLYDLCQLASWYGGDNSKLEEALEIRRTIVARFPDNLEVALDAAKFMMANNRPDLCLQCLYSIESRATNSDVFWYLKSIALQAKSTQDSLACIDRAIQLNPKEISYYHHRFWIKRYLHEDLDALHDLDTILQIEPGNWQAREERARTRMDCRKFNESLEDLKLLSNSGTTQKKFEACIMMADLYKRKGALREAHTTIQRAHQFGHSQQLERLEEDIKREAKEVGIRLK